ncbi:hypothetical protein V6N13_069916 [Hibiscus sabdariffa]|uniref:Uncharacterized protein n=1 Tax=Hibiscus sabdariffa TaxID=183260 RepID=A0ABR2BIZ0_9ROSI
MQAPSRKRRGMQQLKTAPVASMNSSPKKVVKGFRFEVLSTEDESNAHETASTISRMRDMVINAGSTRSAKGKDVGAIGVGSSKGSITAGVSRVRSVLDSLDAIKEVPFAVNQLHQMSHVAVRVIDDDQGSVLRDLNGRSGSGPVRTSGSEALNRSTVSAKSLYKKGPRSQKKDPRKGSANQSLPIGFRFR